MEDEDENRVEDGVDDSAYEHADHGIFRASVCARQIAHAVCDDEKGHAKRYDAGIGLRVGHDVGRRPEGGQKRRHEELYEDCVQDAEDNHHTDAVPDDSLRDILFPCAQVERESGGAPDADEERDGKADRGEGIGDVCGGVSEVADALSDENLVHDIVKRTHEHGDDARYGKTPQQRGDFFISERVLVLFQDGTCLCQNQSLLSFFICFRIAPHICGSGCLDVSARVLYRIFERRARAVSGLWFRVL